MTDKPRFIDCVLAGNSAGKSGGAVYVCCCGSAVLENCTVASNAAPEGSAFTCVGPSHLDATRTIIAFHTEGTLVKCGGICRPELRSCDLYGNAGGDSIPCLKATWMQGNISVDPGFRDRDAMDFRLPPGSPLGDLGLGARETGSGAREP